MGEIAMQIMDMDNLYKWWVYEIMGSLACGSLLLKHPSFKAWLPVTEEEVELVDIYDEDEDEEICIESVMHSMNIWRKENHNVFKNSDIFWKKFFEEMGKSFNI